MDEPRLLDKKVRGKALKNLLAILLVIGVVLGLAVGLVIRGAIGPLDPKIADYVTFPGNILIRLLKLSATPLIIACIVVALGSLDLTVSKTLGWQFMIYIIITKIVSSILGLLMAVAVRPGIGDYAYREEIETSTNKHSIHRIHSIHSLHSKGSVLDILLDMFRNIIPVNMMRIYLQKELTKVVSPVNGSSDVLKWDINITYIDHMNLLGMISIATLVGLCFTILENRSQGFLVIVKEIYQVSMKLAIWTLWTAPVCLFFLILTEIMMIKDFRKFFSTWGIYLLAINGTFLLQIVVIHPVILFVFTRVNVIHFYKDMVRAFVTAYVTSSSMASLPVLVDCLVQHGVDRRVVDFLVPIGVNLNKDGAASFLALATVFIAQMTDETLDFGDYAIILFLSSFGSVASAAVPFGAVIVLVVILNALDFQQNLIGGILAVEWINDRGQTLTNIAGNAIPPKVLEKWNKKLLKDTKEEEGKI